MNKLFEVTVYIKYKTVVAAKTSEDAFELANEQPLSEWEAENKHYEIFETYEDNPRDD